MLLQNAYKLHVHVKTPCAVLEREVEQGADHELDPLLRLPALRLTQVHARTVDDAEVMRLLVIAAPVPLREPVQEGAARRERRHADELDLRELDQQGERAHEHEHEEPDGLEQDPQVVPVQPALLPQV